MYCGYWVLISLYRCISSGALFTSVDLAVGGQLSEFLDLLVTGVPFSFSGRISIFACTFNFVQGTFVLMILMPACHLKNLSDPPSMNKFDLTTDQSAVCKWPQGLLMHSVVQSELSYIILAVLSFVLDFPAII